MMRGLLPTLESSDRNERISEGVVGAQLLSSYGRRNAPEGISHASSKEWLTI